MGGKLDHTPQRKMSDKMFRPCQKRWGVTQPLGKFCNRRCKKIKRKKCEKWELKIIDTMKEKDFDFLNNGSFILIDEDQVL